MSERICLLCGVGEAEVRAVRASEGYTPGCGIEANTEAGFDYEELSPRHRWAPWRDAELNRMGIKPEAYEKYRTVEVYSVMWASCDDLLSGHNYAVEDICWGDVVYYPAGTCKVCGVVAPPKNEGGIQ